MHIWRQWLCNYIEPSVFNCQAAHYYAYLCPVFVENSDVVGGFVYEFACLVWYNGSGSGRLGL